MSTYPRVKRPTTDTCTVCHALGHETMGYVWYPTHEGDRPMCRTHVLALDTDAHGTTDEHTSEHGNYYPSWDEDECTCEDEDECTCRTDEDVYTADEDECTDDCLCREDERARIVGDLLADVVTLRITDQYARRRVHEIRRAIRIVLDLDSCDDSRWLCRWYVDDDESGDDYTLRVWDEADVNSRVTLPTALLVREYVWTDEAGTYVPRTRVYVPSLYTAHEDDHECVRVDLPRDWHEDI